MRHYVLYMAGILLTMDLGVLYLSETYGLTAASATRVAHVLLWLAGASYLGTLINRLEGDSAPDEIAGTAAFIAIGTAPIAFLVFSVRHTGTAPVWAILLSMAVMLLMLLTTLREGTTALQYIAGIWSVSTTVVQLGQSSIMPYAREFAAKSRAIHVALDIRIATGCLMLAVIAVSAIGRAVARGVIDVDDLERVHMRPPDPRLHALWIALLAPLINLAETLLQIAYFLVNLFWKAVVTICIFFQRIGEALVQVVVETVTTNGFVRTIMTVAASWVGLLAMFAAGCRFAELLSLYLLTPRWFAGIVPLIKLLFLALAAATSAAFVAWSLDRVDLKRLTPEALFVFSNFLAVVLCAGLGLVLLARIDSMGLARMRWPGVYSWSMLLLSSTAILLREKHAGQ